MASKSVAVVEDGIATPGTVLYSPAVSGTWTPGGISYTGYEKLTIGGVKVIYRAECTFTFSGLDSNSVTVTGSETVTLEAATKLLQGKQSFVLVNGDQAEGHYGNKLAVQCANPLRSG